MEEMKMLVITMMSRIYVAFLLRRIILAGTNDHTRSPTLSTYVRADSHWPCLRMLGLTASYRVGDVSSERL